MRFDAFFLRTFSRFALAALLTPVAATAQSIPPKVFTQVSFTKAEQLIAEHENASVTVQISQATMTNVVVPFTLGGSATLQIAQPSANGEGELELSDGDYYLPADTDPDDDNGILFDPATKSGVLTFRPGVRNLTLNFEINDDFEEEPTEQIIVSIDPGDEPTIWQPVAPLTHTITIQDNDPIAFWIDREVYEVAEGNTVTLAVRASAPPPGAVAVPFTYTFQTASEDDFARSQEGNLEISTSPITFSAGQLQAGISFTTAADRLEEGTETFTVKIGEPLVDGASVGFEYDASPTTVRIRDQEPVTVGFNTTSFRETSQSATRVSEGEAIELPITLSGRVTEPVELTFEFGGNAVRQLEDKEGDWSANLDDDSTSLTIDRGSNSTTLQIRAINDMEQDGDKSLTIRLASAKLATSGESLPIRDEEGHPRTYTITLVDNDPVSLGFGRANPYFDPADPDSKQLIDDTRVITSERNGSITIPVYLTGLAPETVTFDVEFLDSGTTATPRDFDTDPNAHDWDFYLSSVFVPTPGAKGEARIAPGSIAYSLVITFNDEQEPPLPYSLYKQFRDSNEPLPEPYDTIERDETIRLRISNVNTADSGVSIREEAREIEVVIKEMPDIDVTELYDGVFPASEDPVRSPKTGFHEVLFTMTPTDEHDLSLEDFPGYRSLKLAFRPGIFHGRDAEGNDPLRTVSFTASGPVNITPDGQSPFALLLDPPYQVYYAVGTQFHVVDEGEERVDRDFFNEANADIIIAEPYVLQPMNFPILDDDFPERQIEGNFTFEDPLDFTVEFSNRGRRDFEASRLDPSREDAVRLLISPVGMAQASKTEFTGDILALTEEANGEILIEFSNPSRTDFHIEYLTEEGIWKLAQPGLMSSPGTRIFWKDTGPPKTHPHPSDAQFRIYRITN